MDVRGLTILTELKKLGLTLKPEWVSECITYLEMLRPEIGFEELFECVYEQFLGLHLLDSSSPRVQRLLGERRSGGRARSPLDKIPNKIQVSCEGPGTPIIPGLQPVRTVDTGLVLEVVIVKNTSKPSLSQFELSKQGIKDITATDGYSIFHVIDVTGTPVALEKALPGAKFIIHNFDICLEDGNIMLMNPPRWLGGCCPEDVLKMFKDYEKELEWVRRKEREDIVKSALTKADKADNRQLTDIIEKIQGAEIKGTITPFRTFLKDLRELSRGIKFPY